MRKNDDLLKEKVAVHKTKHLPSLKGAQAAQQALIIQPGAIGDCILTLPLAQWMKTSLRLKEINFLGHTDYIDIFPCRTCVDNVISIDSINLHRLFVKPQEFFLEDYDSLIDIFADYNRVVTFLGKSARQSSNFEQNLIFTLNCSHSAEVITLPLKPHTTSNSHISNFYVKQFIKQSFLPSSFSGLNLNDIPIKPTKTDIDSQRGLLEKTRVNLSAKLLVIQPASGGVSKCWYLDNFCAIAQQARSEGIEVVFLLGPAELDRYSRYTISKIRKIAPCVSGLSLAQVLQLVSSAACFLGNDSGITHLSAALGTKTLAVLGPSSSPIYKPIGPDVTIFQINKRNFDRPSPVFQQRLLEAILDL